MAANKRKGDVRRNDWVLLTAFILGLVGGTLVGMGRILRAGDTPRRQLVENLQTRLASGACVDHLAASVAAGKAAARRRQSEL